MDLNLVTIIKRFEKFMKLVDETVDAFFEIFEDEEPKKKRDYMDAEIINEKEIRRR